MDRMGRDELFYRICHINDSAMESKESVLSSIRNVTNPNFQDYNGDSYLHMACQAHSIEAISLLLELGADPNITNNRGAKPVLRALGRLDPNNEQILLLMLQNGLKLDEVVNGKTVKQRIEELGNKDYIDIISKW